jgi:hypothetical protein
MEIPDTGYPRIVVVFGINQQMQTSCRPSDTLVECAQTVEVQKSVGEQHTYYVSIWYADSSSMISKRLNAYEEELQKSVRPYGTISYMVAPNNNISADTLYYIFRTMSSVSLKSFSLVATFGEYAIVITEIVSSIKNYNQGWARNLLVIYNSKITNRATSVRNTPLHPVHSIYFTSTRANFPTVDMRGRILPSNVLDCSGVILSKRYKAFSGKLSGYNSVSGLQRGQR